MFDYCATFYGPCGEFNTSFYERNGNGRGIPDESIPPLESLFTNNDEVDTRVCNCAPFSPDQENICNCN